ncbi:cation diffusion facilitator family transporter [Faecalimonas sp.]
MHATRTKQKKERSALNISLIAGLIFSLLEVIIAIYTHSQAVLLDGFYDGVESIMIIISIGIVPLLYRSSNEKRPFGYLQIESFFVVIKGFTMIAITIGLIATNIEIVLNGGRHIAFSNIAYFELFATILSMFVIFLLRKKNAKTHSALVSMEIQEWTIDAIASLGMAIAFFLPLFIKVNWFSKIVPYLDQIIAILLSLFMLPTPIRTIITGLRDIFLIAPEEETVTEIKNIINPILDSYGYKQLSYDIIRTGRKLWISVYITFDKDLISISRLRIVQHLIIEALKKEYQDFYFELLPEVEYLGNTEVR